MQHINVGDVELAVELSGSGPPILMVHGFPLTHAMWQKQKQGLAGYQLILPDLCGFGESTGRKGAVTMEQYADDLSRLLDGLGIEGPVTFCGLSMGGYVGFQFLRKYPQCVSRLVLCDTRAAADTAQAADGRRATAAKVQAEGAQVVASAMLAKLISAETQHDQPELATELDAMMRAQKPEAIAGALLGMAVRPDSTPLLSGINVPTLVLGGKDDAIVPVAEMAGMAQAIPGAKFVEIASAGHMAPWEQPQAVNAALAMFLAS